jgi:hypothetical protein
MFKTTISLSALLMLLGGCSGAGAGPTDEEVTGSAMFTLTTTGSQDSAFRFVSAELELDGPESMLVTPADGEVTAFAELAPGAYVSRLLDNWRVQQKADGMWQDVAARLEDDPEKPFSIAAGEVTEIFYRFTVDNDARPSCQRWPSTSRVRAASHKAAFDRTTPVPPALRVVPPVPTARFSPPLPSPGPRSSAAPASGI